MGLELLLGLAVLALIDSTSIGTLLIPVWLLLDPRQVNVSRLMVYLLTIAGFYLILGLVIVFAADFFLGGAEIPAETVATADGEPSESSWISVVQMLIGGWLFYISFRFDSSKPGAMDRVNRWKHRTAEATNSPHFLMGLAMFAAMAEAATMLPYLGAMAMIANARLPAPLVVLLMAAYCIVMIMPALMLMLLRTLFATRIEPALIKVDNWISRNAESALGWTLGVAGFLIARDAITRLW
ncbi:MAG TPA: GAP family protein [Pseudohongiella sp.]|nr:GAP family protein [Pseudohongiella sp.]